MMTNASFPAPLGSPPSIEWISPSQLRVDDSYQRSTGTTNSQRHISRIAHEWDWRLCQPLAVSRRIPSGELFVIDGQHRLEAARLRGDIAHLPCCVATFTDYAVEARLFVAANRGRRPITRFEDHRAALAAGDAEALSIEKVLSDAGLAVAENGSALSWKPGELGCIAGVRSALRLHGVKVVSAALANLAEAFPDEPLIYAGTLLTALCAIHAKPPANFEADRLFEVLLTKTQQEWIEGLAMMATSRSMAARELRLQLLSAYAAGVRDSGGGGWKHPFSLEAAL